jgi:hypothetical protein
MRLITAAGEWNPPKLSKKFAGDDAWKSSRNPLQSRDSVELLLERRRYQRTNLVSADEHEANETNERESRITEKELERATPNPDDERFYPGNYRTWRFDMGENDEEDGDDDDSRAVGDIKMLPQRWVPYHRLDARCKLVVEMKLGPKIKRILWTRWPGATIEKFTPAEESLPIV